MFLPGDMAAYLAALNGAAGTQTRFWIVLRVKKQDFGDRLEMHPTIDMMVPKDGFGEFVGLVRDGDELYNLVTADPKKDDDKKKDFVYLIYKVKVTGQTGWRNLIEFLAKNEMLEEDQEH